MSFQPFDDLLVTSHSGSQYLEQNATFEHKQTSTNFRPIAHWLLSRRGIKVLPAGCDKKGRQSRRWELGDVVLIMKPQQSEPTSSGRRECKEAFTDLSQIRRASFAALVGPVRLTSTQNGLLSLPALAGKKHSLFFYSTCSCRAQNQTHNQFCSWKLVSSEEAVFAHTGWQNLLIDFSWSFTGGVKEWVPILYFS